MGKFDEIVEGVNTQIDQPLATPNFGDHWKEYATNQSMLDKDDFIDMAWRQGRRAILLERIIKSMLIVDDDSSISEMARKAAEEYSDNPHAQQDFYMGWFAGAKNNKLNKC